MNSHKNLTVLVTGASGYIGRHVVKALGQQGATVVASDLRSVELEGCSRFIEADLFSPTFRLLDHFETPPDVCLHLAWRNGFQHNDTAHMIDLSNHFMFVKKLADEGVSRIAIMGTMHEIGYWEGAVDENTPCNPLSLYGIAKDALRKSSFLYLSGHDVDLQWLRAYYIVGDEASSQSIFGKILQAAYRGETVFPFTTGTNKYDFISITDLAQQIAACVMQDEVTGIINCCSGEPVSLADRVESFIKAHNLNIKLEYGAFPDRPYDSPAIWGDPQKIRQIMGQSE